ASATAATSSGVAAEPMGACTIGSRTPNRWHSGVARTLLSAISAPFPMLLIANRRVVWPQPHALIPARNDAPAQPSQAALGPAAHSPSQTRPVWRSACPREPQPAVRLTDRADGGCRRGARDPQGRSLVVFIEGAPAARP